MRFSFHIPVPTPRLEYMYEGVKKAEESGFFGIFYADHTTMSPQKGTGTCYDAYCYLTALAMITKKVKLCTGVSDCHRFHPALMAHKVATLDQISNGRAMIGLGAGEAMNIDMYGLSRRRSVSKLREYIILLRKFWTEKNVNHKSDLICNSNKLSSTIISEWSISSRIRFLPKLFGSAPFGKSTKYTSIPEFMKYLQCSTASLRASLSNATYNLLTSEVNIFSFNRFGIIFP